MPAILRSRFPQIIASMRPAVTTAIHAGAELISQDAKSRVPVGEDAPHLKEAIHVRKSGPSGLEAHVVAGDDESYYGHMIENGTVHQPPRPFLVPAKEAREDDVVTSVASVIKAL